MTAAHVYICSSSVEPHEEPLPAHRIKLDCESKWGYPHCMGCAAMGPHHCTCETLTEQEYAKCLADAEAAHRERGGEMCHDCAFRKGSPEQEELARIAADPTPFRCHQGAPVDARGGSPIRDAYVPRTVNGEAVGYPICAGWLRARAGRKP